MTTALACLLPFILADESQAGARDIIGYVVNLGPTGLLTLFGWLWFTGRIVTRRELDAADKRCEEWKSTAMRAIGNNERLVGAAEKTASLAGGSASEKVSP